MLLSRERITAASRICRFNGWTTRHYSILEHSVIGAKLMVQRGYPTWNVRAFLLHDLEETAIVGDVATPQKELYMNERYFRDVHEWNEQLCRETGVTQQHLDHPVVHEIDAVMLAAESQTVSMLDWQAMHTNDCLTDVAKDMIRGGKYSGDKCVGEFWSMWGSYI